MNQINYLSDIKLLENYPKTDNFIYHFTTDGETCYNVSLEDGNCRKDGDYLVICLDNHGLPEGQLKVRREFHFPDDDFPDKEWTKIVEHSYDIYLAEGVDIEADQYVLPTYMPIFRGEKGDDGEDYVITEEDYEEIADIAATKVDCYSTEEADEKFQVKLTKYDESGQNVKVGEGFNYVEITPDQLYLQHGTGIEPNYGNITINNKAIILSKEGFTDSDDVEVVIANGKMTVNSDEVLTVNKINEAFKNAPTVTYRQFNSGFVNYGWCRTTGEFGPGVPTYDGLGLTLITKETYTDSSVIRELQQVFFRADNNDITTRYATYEVSKSGTTATFYPREWTAISKTYTSGTGITVSSNGSISLTQKFKTVNGESIEGDGDIKVGSDLKYYKEEEDQASITVGGNNGISVMSSGCDIIVSGDDVQSNIALDAQYGIMLGVDSQSTDSASGLSITPLSSGIVYTQDGVNNSIILNKEGAYYNDSEIATTEDIKTVNDKITELELYKTPNVVIYGYPAISNGQISDFSQSDYLQFPFLVDFKQQYFLIQMCFTTGDNVTSQENIFDSEYGLAFAIRNGHFVIATSFDGQSWAGENVGTYNVLPNTTYYVKFRWLNGNYNLSYSLDNSTYNNDIQFYSLSTPYPKQIIIGKSSNNAFSGIINLNYCSLYIGDREVWRGMDDVGLSTRLQTDLGNIDAAGEAKIKELAGGKYYFEIEEDGGNARFREAGIKIQDEEAGTEATIRASDYKSSETSDQNVGFGVADPYKDSSINANTDAVELTHNHWIEGGEEGGYNIIATFMASDDGAEMYYENDETKQVILNNDGFFYNDSPIATEERVQELINSAIGDMDAILDIMLGTSDIDGQLNRIIG